MVCVEHDAPNFNSPCTGTIREAAPLSPPYKKKPSAALQKKLSRMEERAAERNIHIHYDRLEAAGLKLKDGICKLNGEYHIFVDRRKPLADKIDIIQAILDQPISDIPELGDESEGGA
jgi:hypothetical protein